MKMLTGILLVFAAALSGSGDADRTVTLPEVEFPGDTLDVDDCRKCVVITEQARPSVRIVETMDGSTVWEWRPAEADELEDAGWFSSPDEAKPVYGRQYMLVTASGGGVALIRIADKKVVFHAWAGGNPHSAELFPDGNLVVASSTGNYLTVFHVDTLAAPGDVKGKQYPIPDGHNVVWDRERKSLWSAGKDKLYRYTYDFACEDPGLVLKETIQLPGNNAHDLFPVYGKDSLWLTNTSNVYYVDLETREVTRASLVHRENIKSVSSGPEGFPVIIMKPEEKWWSDKVLGADGKAVFQEDDLRIYKARWFLDNPFSYRESSPLRVCH